jgi:hypothetical protein
MSLNDQLCGPVGLRPGPSWPSFDKFRLAGPAGLEQITPGTVGTLQIKSNSYVILRSADYQRLVGLAADVERVANGFTLVRQAALAFASHPDDPDVKGTLLQAVTYSGQSPALPTRDQHPPLEPEGFETDGDDGYELDPLRLRSPMEGWDG